MLFLPALILLAVSAAGRSAPSSLAPPAPSAPTALTAPSAPYRGWSSWNAFRLDINETKVKTAADLMAKSLLTAGYEYILIDDGWPSESARAGAHPSRPRDADGRIPVSAAKFPSGFKHLTDYVHGLGLKIGIYTAVSTWTCGGYTGSLGHEAVDAQAFVEWGFDLVKHDTCGGMNGEPVDECGVGTARPGEPNCIKESTTRMAAALAKAAAAAGRSAPVYYVDHGNPTSPQVRGNAVPQ